MIPDSRRSDADRHPPVAGSGADTVYGGRGADTIFAGNDHARDTLFGGPGPDHIYTHNADTVRAGYGDDTIEVWGTENIWNIVTVICGPGHDTVIMHSHMGLNTDNCERVIRP